MLEEVDRSNVSSIGWKAANLGELLKMGMPVPPGFALTKKAYARFLEANKIRTKVGDILSGASVDDIDGLKQASGEIINLIMKSQMPDFIRNDIKDAYEELSVGKDIKKVGGAALDIIKAGRGQVFVAARSSAIEDSLASAGFAGRLGSTVGAQGREQIYDAVKRCWASMFMPWVIYYRKKNGLEGFPEMGVVVQKMVDAEKSGIVFTTNPAYGNIDHMVVEAVWGYGESLVSGIVTPDEYMIVKETGKIESKKIGKKKWMRRLNQASGVVDTENVDRSRVSTEVLAETELKRLWEMGKRVEEHYGSPQDMEWVSERGRIYIVQARSVTSTGMGAQGKQDEAEAESETGTQSPMKGKMLVKGEGVSPGTATGTVRVVSGLEEMGKVQRGDIIVTKTISPAMLPAMIGVAAIVTNEGGKACHAATAAREMGIPCIVGTDIAATMLKDGQKVSLDAASGKVYEFEPPEQPKIEPKQQHQEQQEIEIKQPEPAEHPVSIETLEKIEQIKTPEPGIPPQHHEQHHPSQPQHPHHPQQPTTPVPVNLPPGPEPKPAPHPGTDPGSQQPTHHLQPEQPGQGQRRHFLTHHGQVEALPSMTAGSGKITATNIMVNLVFPDTVDNNHDIVGKADGVGLFRAEHVLTEDGKHPVHLARTDANRLVNTISQGLGKVAKAFYPKPVWYRTLDAKTDEFRELESAVEEPQEVNPIIGWHGTRRSIDQPAVFKCELRAIKRLREEGMDNIAVLLPFVSRVSEIREAIEIMAKIGLRSKIGIIVETPAAALEIEQICKEGIGFVSIGSNNLTQLILGVDRANSKISRIYSEFEPAVLGLIKYVIKTCKRYGIETSICGLAGSNPKMVEVLVGLGISSISAEADAVEEIRKTAAKVERRMLLEKVRDG